MSSTCVNNSNAPCGTCPQSPPNLAGYWESFISINFEGVATPVAHYAKATLQQTGMFFQGKSTTVASKESISITYCLPDGGLAPSVPAITNDLMTQGVWYKNYGPNGEFQGWRANVVVSTINPNFPSMPNSAPFLLNYQTLVPTKLTQNNCVLEFTTVASNTGIGAISKHVRVNCPTPYTWLNGEDVTYPSALSKIASNGLCPGPGPIVPCNRNPNGPCGFNPNFPPNMTGTWISYVWNYADPTQTSPIKQYAQSTYTQNGLLVEATFKSVAQKDIPAAPGVTVSAEASGCAQWCFEKQLGAKGEFKGWIMRGQGTQTNAITIQGSTTMSIAYPNSYAVITKVSPNNCALEFLNASVVQGSAGYARVVRCQLDSDFETNPKFPTNVNDFNWPSLTNGSPLSSQTPSTTVNPRAPCSNPCVPPNIEGTWQNYSWVATSGLDQLIRAYGKTTYTQDGIFFSGTWNFAHENTRSHPSWQNEFPVPSKSSGTLQGVWIRNNDENGKFLNWTAFTAIQTTFTIMGQSITLFDYQTYQPTETSRQNDLLQFNSNSTVQGSAAFSVNVPSTTGPGPIEDFLFPTDSSESNWPNIYNGSSNCNY